MLVRIMWPDGAQTLEEVQSLRELDAFVGLYERRGMRVDLKPYGLGLRMILQSDAAN